MGKEGAKIAGVNAKEIIEDLKRAYCDEWLAYFSYLYMARTVTGMGYEDMGEFLEETAKEEGEHIAELADRIQELGGMPFASFSDIEKNANAAYPKPPKSTTDYKAMIKVVTDAEKDAIDVYQKIAEKTKGKDHVTYQLVCHILSEEVAHEEKFEDLLGD